MRDIAIRVENLSKQHRIGGPQARYKTIRESLTEAVQNRDKGTRRWGDKEQGGVSPCHPLSLSPSLHLPYHVADGGPGRDFIVSLVERSTGG